MSVPTTIDRRNEISGQQIVKHVGLCRDRMTGQFTLNWDEEPECTVPIEDVFLFKDEDGNEDTEIGYHCTILYRPEYATFIQEYGFGILLCEVCNQRFGDRMTSVLLCQDCEQSHGRK